MRKKIEKSSANNTKIAFFFVVFILGVFFVSFLLKAIFILNKSKFDGRNHFVINISNNKDVEFLSLSPKNHTLAILKLKGDFKNMDFKKYLAIPADSFLYSETLDLNKDSTYIFGNILLNYGRAKTDLTIVDVFRIFLYARGILASDIYQKDVSTSLSSLEVDKIVLRYAKDDRIDEENKSIEIVNGTDVVGLGNRLARLITNMGGEVVLVSTSDKLQKDSLVLYTGKKTYTVQKLGDILNFKTSATEGNSIADIKIIIGEDIISKISF